MKESEAKKNLALAVDEFRHIPNAGSSFILNRLVQAARDLLNAEREEELPDTPSGRGLIESEDVLSKPGAAIKLTQLNLTKEAEARLGLGPTITGPDDDPQDVLSMEERTGIPAPEYDPDDVAFSDETEAQRFAETLDRVAELSTGTPRLVEVYRLAKVWHDAIAKWNQAMDSRDPDAADAAEPDMARTQAELFAAFTDHQRHY